MDNAEQTSQPVVINTIAATPVQKPDFALTVIHPFGDYKRGDPITDANEIAAVMAGENRHHCHKVAPQ